MYFGQTRNFNKRSLEHKNDLRCNRHCNPRIQRLFNKGEDLMIFPVEECMPDNLNEREVYWISYHNTFNRVNGYNLSGGGTNAILWSPEVIAKRAKKRRGIPGSLKGKSQSIEHIEARASKNRGQKRVYTSEHLLSIKKAMQARKGIAVGGVSITITSNDNKVYTFDSIRKASGFLDLEERALTNKFYKTRKKVFTPEILYNNYKITRNV
jgi:group I intron endonuclease